MISYRTLLKLDHGYSEHHLFQTIEKYKWLLNLNYSVDDIFSVEYKRLKLEDDKNGL